MHSILCVKHKWGDTTSNHSRKQRNTVSFFFCSCRKYGWGQLAMITNEYQLPTAPHKRYKNCRFRGLRSFVNENSIKGHRIQNVTTRSNARTTNNLCLFQ
mmetsp:Transcript_48353/g.100058  ORF Transcript_48353/g.100058 Transcript_48353/m.100058 type:complete len:100 (-) Transcript_48353:1183-1482(-)